MNLRERFLFSFSYTLKAIILVALVASLFQRNYVILFISTLAFILTWIPALLERNYRIHLPIEFEFLIVLFIYASLFLGEVRDYYTRFWWWDVVLHGGAGLVLGVIGFLIMYVLYSEEKLKAKPFWLVLFGFCFAMAMGAVWEIFEFSVDQFFGTNMQKSGLQDTMWDLIVDCCGASIASFVGYFYIRGDRKTVYGKLVQKFLRQNPRLGK
jgi:hypothetical protein